MSRFDIIPPAWMDDAPCAQIGIGTEFWFPAKGTDSRDARKICADCPVRQTCHEYAVTEKLHEGIFGGTTGLDRRRDRAAGAA